VAAARLRDCVACLIGWLEYFRNSDLAGMLCSQHAPEQFALRQVVTRSFDSTTLTFPERRYIR
jgi:hypothetical protein